MTVSIALPIVSEGLREIADSTIQCGGHMSILPVQLGGTPYLSTQIGHISNRVTSVYYETNTHLSIADSDVREFSISFREESEEALGGANIVPEFHEEFLTHGRITIPKVINAATSTFAYFKQTISHDEILNTPTIANFSLNYEIPSNFQYPVRTLTVSQKIFRIAKKVLNFIHKNQVTIAIGLFSFLISKAIANSLENVSTVPTAMNNFQDCQDRICDYWNKTMKEQANEILPTIKNSLSNINFRCNSSDPDYKPYKSLKRCLRDWCKYANVNEKDSKECLDPSKKIVRLWNRFCPKLEFNKLKKSQEGLFFQRCLKKLCNYYKSHNETGNFYSLCVPVELQRSMKKLYKLIKNWKDESLKPDVEGSNSESILSITSSTLGIISAGVSIGASIIACYVAKATMASVSATLPNVSRGLRNIVDGTLAYARRASVMPGDLLSVPSMNTHVSQISSQVSSVYQDANSYLSLEDSDVREVAFHFGNEEEESNLLESNINDKSSKEILRESNNVDQNVADNVVEQFIKATQAVTQKAIDHFTFVAETTPLTTQRDIDNSTFLAETTPYEQALNTTEKTTGRLAELTEGPFPNLTEKFIKATQVIIQKAINNFTFFIETTPYEKALSTVTKDTDNFFEFRQRPVEFVFAENMTFFQEVTQKAVEVLQIVAKKVITTGPQQTFDYTREYTPSTSNLNNSTVLSPLDIFRLRAKMMNMG